MSKNLLIVRGARTNNLKNINLDIPRDKLVVFTGLSGSGKSTLAFETIYAEGHPRQFLGQMDKPDVDLIEGLSPAISIEQKTTSKNPRSTVGTVTEIYDYLRLLYARVGTPHCPVCGREITQQTLDQILDRILALPEGSRFMVLAPVVRAQKGMHEKVFADAKRAGYVRARVDGSLYDLSEEITLDKNKKHSIDIVIDRLILRPDLRPRLGESVENALSLADGRVHIALLSREGEVTEELEFSQKYACEEHQISFGALEPAMFSFNNPLCACPRCAGLGEMQVISEEKLIPHPELSLRQGGLAANGFKTMDEHSYTGPLVIEVGARHGFSIDTPIRDLTQEQRQALLYGTGDETYECIRYFGNTPKHSVTRFEGIIPMIERRMAQAGAFGDYYQQFIEDAPCPVCHGARLNDTVLAVTVGGLNIDRLCRLSVGELVPFFDNLHFDDSREKIAHDIIVEIRKRLKFLSSVGLDYLTLSRKAGTLSGGEAQRIRLATQIGSALVGVLYILDEPSIGLHQRDNGKLIRTLCSLRDLGNTVIVVEHDEETMMAADYIVDIGPGAGIHGGEVVVAGTPKEVAACRKSLTGDYLSGRKSIAVPKTRRPGNGKSLWIRGARENNLKNLSVEIPLGRLVCVTGVSGSGKSSLINTCLERTLARDLNGAITYPGKCDGVEGLEYLDKVIHIDQSPIGRTPRSNPATYTGLFNDIRELFAKTPDAKARAYGAGRFSFNIRGGRCEACQGDGVKCIEMHFLPDVYVKCDVCNGMRYNRDTLDVHYKGKNIYEVLEMTVEEALTFFDGIPQIKRKVQTLFDVGLGYVKLGQSSTTLSGGEAQRVKLATELSRRPTGKTVYILDEPTTGLHTADVAHLIDILNRLVDSGNTVIVIEHNLDLIKTADYLIDLGPEGGDGGGTLVACGTPEEVAEVPASFTGQYLRQKLGLA